MDRIKKTKSHQAESLHLKGNHDFKNLDFSKAINNYTKSLQILKSHVVLSNRALCYIKTNQFLKAENDCSESLFISPNYIKAFIRRGTARKFQNHRKEALEDFRKALELITGIFQEGKNLFSKRDSDYLKKEISVLDRKESQMHNAAEFLENVKFSNSVVNPVVERGEVRKVNETFFIEKDLTDD